MYILLMNGMCIYEFLSCVRLYGAICPNIENCIQIIYYFAMIIIGACNLYYVINIFRTDRKTKEQNTRKEDRRYIFNLMLKYEFPEFFSFFKKIQGECTTLLSESGNGCRQECKEQLRDFLTDAFINYRLDFLIVLSAIDDNLYKDVLQRTDSLQDTLTENLFDAGVNLYVKEKYDQLIVNPIMQCKKETLNILTKYGS